MSKLTVRWLGAFGRNRHGLSEAAKAEISGLGRQVAAEPVFFGESRLSTGLRGALIGLRIDLARSVFVAGWLGDAWTARRKDGTLFPNRSPVEMEQSKRFTDENRLWGAAKRLNCKTFPGRYISHGEVIVDYPVYDAVICVAQAEKAVKAKAAALAEELGLPLVFIPRRAHSGQFM